MNEIELINKFRFASGFYGTRLKNVNDYSAIPFTTKQELIESQEKHPPFGDFTNHEKPFTQVYKTSGTSNNPLLLAFTSNDINRITEIGADCFRYAGMGHPGNKEIVINCMNLSMWAGGFLDSQAMQKTGVSVVNFGTGKTSELIRLIYTLRKNHNVSLHCTPSYLPALSARLANEFGMAPGELGLYCLYLGGEGGVQNNSFRDNLKREWNSKVLNANYGMSEVCSIMASANDENMLRFSSMFLDNYRIQLLTAENVLVDSTAFEEKMQGDLILSSYHKESQPILKYHSNERIRIICLRKGDVFFEVIGRSDDMIVYKGINIFPEQFRKMISEIAELSGIYTLSATKKDGIVTDLTLVCELKKWTTNTVPIEKGLSAKIKSELNVTVSVVCKDKIEIKGNKLKLIEIIEK